ncbi:serine/arginine repetitive matrix protein 1-like [Pogoniulus pusillus]|uniref:serine/arginine repetitive matrix protein 1-like n=1 Tax=Pogoniulus pusillus TaxID=488313 RepID=UPI0030B97166
MRERLHRRVTVKVRREDFKRSQRPRQRQNLLAQRLAPADKRSPHACGAVAGSPQQRRGPATLWQITACRQPPPFHPVKERARKRESGDGAGGRQTLGGLQTPPQNGGHLWQALFSPTGAERPPQPQPDRAPQPRFEVSAQACRRGRCPPFVPLGGAEAPAPGARTESPHLKWRPPRFSGWSPCSASPQLHCSSTSRRARRARRQAWFRRASLEARSGKRAQHSSRAHQLGLSARRRRRPQPAPARAGPRCSPVPEPRARSSRPAPLTSTQTALQLRNEGEQRRYSPLYRRRHQSDGAPDASHSEPGRGRLQPAAAPESCGAGAELWPCGYAVRPFRGERGEGCATRSTLSCPARRWDVPRPGGREQRYDASAAGSCRPGHSSCRGQGSPLCPLASEREASVL